MVNVPANVNTVPFPNCKVLPAVTEVKLLNVVAPVITDVAVVSKVTVPLEWVKAPVLEKFLATVKGLALEAVDAALAAMLKSRLTSMVGSLVSALTVTAFVPSPMVRSLLTVYVPLDSTYVAVPVATRERL